MRAAGLAVVVWALVAVGAGNSWIRNAEASPEVVGYFPAAAAANVSAAARVAVVFDRPLAGDADRLEFTVADSSGASVSAAVRLDEGLTAAEFEPTKPLLPGDYTARVEVPQVVPPKEWSFTVPVKRALSDGPGGPVLLVTSKANDYDEFHAEILRAEGFTGFSTIDSGALTAQALADHRVVIVSGDAHVAAATPALRHWVLAGGHLVVTRPTGPLADLAGHRRVGGQVVEGHLVIDAGSPYGHGLTSEPLRIHGAADVVEVTDGVDVVATVATGSPAATGSPVATASTATADADPRSGRPAVTVRSLGERGGTVAAFTFDLARSVVLTRQGNPDWAGQERDGVGPLRSNDLFFGAGAGAGVGDSAPDHVDLERVAVPQADEQMRILSNILVRTTAPSGPLPRFWYFPEDAAAVLVMAADDHATKDGTRASFQRMLDVEPDGCDIARWECPRATSWLYPAAGITDEEALAFHEQGFDLGAHVSTNCQNWSEKSLDLAFAQSLRAFRVAFPSLPPQHGSRLHCIVWSDYVTQPEVERSWGVRFDMNYYYWPAPWVAGRAGFMTGSGLPMRFSDVKGGLINVYQQETHLVDEVFAGSPDAVERLLDRAQGPEGYYGAFGTHYDFTDDFDVQLMQIAQRRQVPMVSAQQLLTWTDGRSASIFQDLRWSGREVSFAVAADERTNGALRAMLPVHGLGTKLTEIRRDGEVVDLVVRTIKGTDYAFFDGVSGDYVASYGPPA